MTILYTINYYGGSNCEINPSNCVKLYKTIKDVFEEVMEELSGQFSEDGNNIGFEGYSTITDNDLDDLFRDDIDFKIIEYDANANEYPHSVSKLRENFEMILEDRDGIVIDRNDIGGLVVSIHDIDL